MFRRLLWRLLLSEGKLGTPQVLTIDEAVTRVMTHHPGVLSARSSEQSSAEMVNVAKSRYYPRISGGLSSDYDRYRTGRYQEKHLQSAEINAEQLLYDFGKTAGAVKKAEFGNLRAQAATRVVLERLARDAARATIHAVRFERLTRIAQDQASEVGELARLVEQRYQKGASNWSDVLQVRSRKDAVEAMVLNVEAESQQWLRQLALLTHLPSISAASLEGFPTALSNSCTTQDVNWDLAPEVIAADMAAKEASADLDVAKAEEWPTLSLQGGMSRALNATPEYGGRVDARIQLNISMPFYQGGGLSASKRAAAGALQGAIAERSQVRLQTQQSLADLVSRYYGMTSREGPLNNRVKNISGTKALYKKQYLELGSRSLVDLLNAEQEYHQARVDAVNNEFDQKELLIECAYLQGLLEEGFDVANLN